MYVFQKNISRYLTENERFAVVTLFLRPIEVINSGFDRYDGQNEKDIVSPLLSHFEHA